VKTLTVQTFATSGSTGAPVGWERTAEQLRAEAELLAALCAGDGVDGIVCYPPPEHLYGHLMSRSLPELLGVPVRPLGLTEPLDAAFAGLRRPLVATVPAALNPLTRSVALLGRLDRLTVVHSSAILPAAALRLIDRLDGQAKLVELFGSTETGLVATRRYPSPDYPEWTLAPDVRFGTGMRPDRESPLRVRSPRIAGQDGRPPAAEYELDDLVVPLDGQRFAWLGRRSRLVKVNGRRLNLDRVLDTIREGLGGDVPISCQPHADDLRGEWFRVLVEDEALVAAVARACRRLPAWQQPSAVTTSASIVDSRSRTHRTSGAEPGATTPRSAQSCVREER
jgi:acyl-coenzyme A synthetase/AMP-(fatty) acid ligase